MNKKIDIVQLDPSQANIPFSYAYDKQIATVYYMSVKERPILNENDFFQQLDEKFQQCESIALMTQIALGQFCYLHACGCLKLNLDANSREDTIQRNIVTSDDRKSEIVMSCINGDHAGGVLDIQVDSQNNILVVDDGMQRLTALFEYVQGKYPITKLGSPLDGMYFDDLPANLKNTIRKREMDIRMIHHLSSARRANRFATLNTHTALNKPEKLCAKFSENALVAMAIELGNKSSQVQEMLMGNKKDNTRFEVSIRLLMAVSLCITDRYSKKSSMSDSVEAFLKNATEEELEMARWILANVEDICCVMKRIGGDYLGRRFVAVNHLKPALPLNEDSDERLKNIFGIDDPSFTPSQRLNGDNLLPGNAVAMFAFVYRNLEELDGFTLSERQNLARRLDAMMSADTFRSQYIDHCGAGSYSVRLKYIEDTYFSYIEENAA